MSRISASVLRRWIDIPEAPRELRDLLDDIGVEVKRLEVVDGDPHLNLELLANRGDHYCYEGVAREIAGRTGQSVCQPDIAPLELGESPHPMHSESQEGCLVYTLTLLERAGEGELPEEARDVLVGAYANSVSGPVDATNVANFEFGQPSHAFDADKIRGAIRVRLSRAGETAHPLFQEERVDLPEGTLVIADDEKILAIAGVIGCEESKTTDQTTRILLESATFDPVLVRKASRALGIHTDSSARFERGSDPIRPLIGAGRVVHLLEQAGWQRVGTTGAIGSWSDPNRTIALNIASAAGFLEYPLTETEVRARLTRYGFTVSPAWPEWSLDEGWTPPAELADAPRDRLRQTVLVRVPPVRLWDCEFPADLYEELAKSIGYSAIPTSLPPIDLGGVPSRPEVVRDTVEDVLVAAGFYEVITDGFYGRDQRTKLGIDEEHPLWPHVETQNALDRAYSLLKNNCLAQALDVVSQNLRMRTQEVKAYEWTRTFHPDPLAANHVCTERSMLWFVANGHDGPLNWAGANRPADAWFVKGLVEEIAVRLGLDLTIAKADSSYPLSSCLHPNRQAVVRLGDRTIGILGEVHPSVLKNARIKRARPVYAELALDDLLATPTPRRVEEPPSVHPILRSLAFSLPGRVEAGDVQRVLSRGGPDWLESVTISDVFETEEQGTPVRAVTFALCFSQEDATRSADEVNAQCEALASAVVSTFGDRGVAQR